MQHRFRYGASEKNLHGGEITRAIGKRIDKARDSSINFGPVSDRRPAKFCGMCDGRNVNKKIGGTAKSGVNNHGVSNRGVG
jgi:hypothetical protein